MLKAETRLKPRGLSSSAEAHTLPKRLANEWSRAESARNQITRFCVIKLRIDDDVAFDDESNTRRCSLCPALRRFLSFIASQILIASLRAVPVACRTTYDVIRKSSREQLSGERENYFSSPFFFFTRVSGCVWKPCTGMPLPP